MEDWQGSAAFDRLDDEDSWAASWARAYVEFAAGEKRPFWPSTASPSCPPSAGPSAATCSADGHGNSVPRFHVAWGTGTGVVKPFVDAALAAAASGLVTFHHRHRVDELISPTAPSPACAAPCWPTTTRPRRAVQPRRGRRLRAVRAAVVITTGGIGGNHEIVRRYWPERLGRPRRR